MNDVAAPPRKLPPWPVLAIVSGLLVGLSQPILIESISGKAVLDSSGLTGLLALFGLVPAFVAIDGQGPKRAYAVGFVTWLVAFSCIVHWILTTVHVYGGLPLPVGIAVLLLLTSAMAAYVAASFAVARVISRFFGLPQWMVLPVTVGAVELLRNVGPVGGFPWGSLGHAFATLPTLLQSASVVGVTGLTVLAVAVNAGLAAVVSALWSGRRPPLAAGAMAAIVVVGMLGFGAARLSGAPTDGPSIRIALLQPNVNEGLADLTREPKPSILKRFHEMEREALERGADVILWPEGSFPTRGLSKDLKDFQNVKLLPDGLSPPQASVVGASAVGTIGKKGERRSYQRHNSAFILDNQLVVKGRFDKTHLVPFGEYVPWPFGGIVRQFIPLGTLTPGDHLNPTEVMVNGKPTHIGVTICYEGIFPEVSRAIANNGATFIANLTDDRWYGVSGMATQHLLMYAVRAVEVGRPIARATNTGISAWIDVYGGIHDRTGMYEQALVVADMPIATTDTLYLMVGDWLAMLCLLLTLGAWFWAMVGGTDVLSRPRTMPRTVLAVLGVALTITGVVRWLMASGLDETASTQNMLFGLSGLLVGLGALSDRVWGRRAAMIVAEFAVVFGGVAFVLSRDPVAIGVCVAGAVVFGVARALKPVRAAPLASSPSPAAE
jgi:apolipoprotein N-acyltransferase